MSFQTILSGLVFCAMAAGLLDLLLGKRFGLGAELEKGIMSAGRLILIMTGFMTLAPTIAQVLSPVVTPVLMRVGCDPSAFAGLFLANDSGGGALAMEMALDVDAGLYNGLIVGSMLGSVFMFLIAMTMAYTTERERPAAIYGLISGIIAIPPGCVIGGLVAGFELEMVLRNSIPCLVLSVLLLIALTALKEKVVPFFNLLGKIMLSISYFGLAVAALDSLLGITLVEGTAPLEETLYIIGNIALFLAGAFPMLAVAKKILKRPLQGASRLLGVNQTEMSGMIATLANNLPTFAALCEMSPRGVMLNMAFLVSASCALGDHLAYTAQVAPQLVTAVVVGKMTAAISGLAVALVLAPKVLKEQTMTQPEVTAYKKTCVNKR